MSRSRYKSKARFIQYSHFFVKFKLSPTSVVQVRVPATTSYVHLCQTGKNLQRCFVDMGMGLVGPAFPSFWQHCCTFARSPRYGVFPSLLGQCISVTYPDHVTRNVAAAPNEVQGLGKVYIYIYIYLAGFMKTVTSDTRSPHTLN